MDIERIKEDLSICYLKTISAINGIALEQFQHDEDSIDVVIKKIITLDDGMKFNSQISVQLKATSSPSQYSITENVITYKLKAKNFNDLCAASAMPSMLALLILPEKSEEWVNWNEDELLLKGKMFWIGLQNNKETSNNSTVSIKIPITNQLNCESVIELLKRVAKGEYV